MRCIHRFLIATGIPDHLNRYRTENANRESSSQTSQKRRLLSSWVVLYTLKLGEEGHARTVGRFGGRTNISTMRRHNAADESLAGAHERRKPPEPWQDVNARASCIYDVFPILEEHPESRTSGTDLGRMATLDSSLSDAFSFPMEGIHHPSALMQGAKPKTIRSTQTKM